MVKNGQVFGPPATQGQLDLAKTLGLVNDFSLEQSPLARLGYNPGIFHYPGVGSSSFEGTYRASRPKDVTAEQMRRSLEKVYGFSSAGLKSQMSKDEYGNLDKGDFILLNREDVPTAMHESIHRAFAFNPELRNVVTFAGKPLPEEVVIRLIDVTKYPDEIRGATKDIRKILGDTFVDPKNPSGRPVPVDEEFVKKMANSKSVLGGIMYMEKYAQEMNFETGKGNKSGMETHYPSYGEILKYMSSE